MAQTHRQGRRGANPQEEKWKEKAGEKKHWGLRVMRRTAEDGRRVGIKEHEPTKRNKVKQRRKNEGEFVEKPQEKSYGEAKEGRSEGR